MRRITRPVPSPSEGRFAIVTIRWAWDAMDAVASGALAPDENAAAYGEVVWSWRRDPGVNPPRLVAGAATVTIKAAHRGEHEANRQTIARGKPGCLGCTCSSTPVLFAARGLRAQSAPGFPCALCRREGQKRSQNPGENHAAGTRVHAFLHDIKPST